MMPIRPKLPGSVPDMRLLGIFLPRAPRLRRVVVRQPMATTSNVSLAPIAAGAAFTVGALPPHIPSPASN
jgi:hypothetical protein